MPNRERWSKKPPASKLTPSTTFTFYLWLIEQGRMNEFLSADAFARHDLESLYLQKATHK